MGTIYKKLCDIDFTKVQSYEYAIDEYYKDISIYDIASYYIHLNHLRDSIYDAEIVVDDKTRYLRINADRNNCLLDFNKINAEQLVMMLETKSSRLDDKIDIDSIIKKITAVDINDYISHVWYEGGGEDYIDVKK